MKRYAHLGTGNYNQRTARLYTDLSYFTSRKSLTADVALLFNSLTGLGRSPAFRHLLVAPYNMHRRILELIAREATNARAGKPARIVAKMNALVDKSVIDALYAASRAGVKVDLIVRGICCLVPEMPDLSENIRVRSLVGRFLEHARIYYFENAGHAPVLMAGSADWMTRNFQRRVEALFPIIDPVQRDWVLKEIIPTEMKDTANSQALHSNGAYAPTPLKKGQKPFSAHEYFIEAAAKRGLQAG
jgi:polyphosphate kinase